MKKLDPTASDADILAAVKEWARLLADERYQDAHDFLHPGEPPWSPQEIELLIRNYGSETPHWSGKTFKVTNLERTPEEEAALEMVLRRTDAPPDEDPERGTVVYGLPLYGAWSDLSAVLNFVIVDGALLLSGPHQVKYLGATPHNHCPTLWEAAHARERGAAPDGRDEAAGRALLADDEHQ